MSELNITIDKNRKRALTEIATEEGKSVDGLLKELIDEFIKHRKISPDEPVQNTMKISESSFSEWNNEEDNIYDEL